MEGSNPDFFYVFIGVMVCVCSCVCLSSVNLLSPLNWGADSKINEWTTVQKGVLFSVLYPAISIVDSKQTGCEYHSRKGATPSEALLYYLSSQAFC